MNQGLLLAGAAAVGYYLYSQSKTPTTAGAAPGTTPGSTPTPAGSTPAPAATTPPPAATTPVTPPPPTGGTRGSGATSTNSLSAIFARLKANAQANGASTGSPDVWNYYLAQAAPSVTPPDPALVFPGYDRTNFLDLTAETYWATMAPYLGGHLGLSGVRRRYFAYGGWD